MRSDVTALVLALALAAGAIGAARAAEPYDLHVILPLTGGGAFVGKGQQGSLDALADVVNKAGGIKGRPLHFVYHDDQSSPQVAVQLANDVLAEKPAVVLGSSLVAMCAAIAPLMRSGPVDYCLSPAYHPAAGSFVFSASSSGIDQTAALVRYYRREGWTKLAVINNTDATGQTSDRAFDDVMARPENKDVQKVESQHFNPTDLSVAAQIERIKASGAQAIVAGVTGSPASPILPASTASMISRRTRSAGSAPTARSSCATMRRPRPGFG